MCFVSSGLVLLGDSNLDYDWVNKMPRNLPSVSFGNFFDSCNPVQRVTKPTRGDAILDLIMSSPHVCTDVLYLPPFYTSDHMMLEFRCTASYEPPHLLPMPNFFKTDFTNINYYLSCINW